MTAQRAAVSASAALYCAVATPFIVLVAVQLLLHAIPDMGQRAGWLSIALIAIIVGHLSWPVRTTGKLLAWPLLLAGSTAAIILFTVGAQHNDLLAVAALALGVALLSAALEASSALLGALRIVPTAACAISLAGFTVAASAPLWLGPWAELADDADAASAVVLVSPLSYLAALVQYDFLRGQWFYVHSSLGSLRFDYPRALPAGAAYLVLAALCRVIAHRVDKHSKHHAEGPGSVDRGP